MGAGEVPEQGGGKKQHEQHQGDGVELQETNVAPALAALVRLKFLLQFIPELLGRAFFEFGFVFFKKVEYIGHDDAVGRLNDAFFAQ